MFQEQKQESRIFGQGNFQGLLIQMIVDKKGQAFATLSAVPEFTKAVYFHTVCTHSKKTVHAITCSIFWTYAFINSAASHTFLPSVYSY